MDKNILVEKLENYKKAINKLNQVLNATDDNDYRIDAIIKRFEFTYELSWKLIRAYLEYNDIEAKSPRECFKEGFSIGLLDNSGAWSEMIEDRNITSHTYDEEDAATICKKIEHEHNYQLKSLSEAIERELLK